MSTDMYTDLARALFCTGVRPEDNSSAESVRAAIEAELKLHDESMCLCQVAQEAGDHPDLYSARMHWCLQTVKSAYPEFSGAA
ncbi:MAG: hypothetical protein ACRDSE_09430 [Pseudonocardiaceae bacterium]